LIRIFTKNNGFKDSFGLLHGFGIINLDFADIKTIIKDAGTAILGDGIASGENRAIKAAQLAIKNPLIENSIDGAQGILLNISGGPDLKLYEVNEAAEVVRNAASSDANIIFGAVIDESMNEKIKVTIIAAGFKEMDKITKEREIIIEKPLIPEEKIRELIEEKIPEDKYEKYNEKPAIEQERKEFKEPGQKKTIPDAFKSMEEEDYLDVPTFLRKNNQSKY